MVMALIPNVRAQSKSWGAISNDNQRFQILASFNNEAVLDRETGLIWERTLPTTGAFDFEEIRGVCLERTTGGRYGWRPPTIEEAVSLFRVSVDGISNARPPNPTYFVYDPATNPKFWTTSSYAPNPLYMRGYEFSIVGGHDVEGRPGARQTVYLKTDTALTWCVRGGSPVE